MKDYSKVEHMKVSIAMFVLLLSMIIMVMLSGCGSNSSENLTISGTITSGNSALSGVTVTLSGDGYGVVTTDSNGYFSSNVSNYSSYTVTPSLVGYTFSPSSVTVYISGQSVGLLNFSGSVSSGV